MQTNMEKLLSPNQNTGYQNYFGRSRKSEQINNQKKKKNSGKVIKDLPLKKKHKDQMVSQLSPI